MKLLSISVQAHIARQIFFPYLKEKLGADVPFSVDDGTLGVWGNRKKALRLAEDSKYHLVIQDDAILCEDFLIKAYKFIYEMDEMFPEETLSFQLYHGHQPQFPHHDMIRAKQRGFVKRKFLFWGVGIATPTHLIEDMIEFGDKVASRQDDTKIKYWLTKNKIPIIFPIPCLVDHRQTHETHSLVPGNNRNRYSPYFIDKATFGELVGLK